MELTASLMDTALALSEKDRAELAYQLLLSLKDAEPDADAEAAWAAEVNRRFEISQIEPSRIRDLDDALNDLQRATLVRK